MNIQAFLLYIGFLFTFFGVACSQPKIAELPSNDKIVTDFEFVGKAGETKKYTVKPGDIPKAPPVPNAYKLVENRGYLVRTDLIAYGDTIFSFNATAISAEELNDVRVLQLVPNEINPSGYEWKDCTVTNEEWLNPVDEYISAERKERMRKYLPSYSQKRISCLLDELKYDNYFVLARQVTKPPTVSFTQIKVSLDDTHLSATKVKQYIGCHSRISEAKT